MIAFGPIDSPVRVFQQVNCLVFVCVLLPLLVSPPSSCPLSLSLSLSVARSKTLPMLTSYCRESPLMLLYDVVSLILLCCCFLQIIHQTCLRSSSATSFCVFTRKMHGMGTVGAAVGDLLLQVLVHLRKGAVGDLLLECKRICTFVRATWHSQ